MKEYFLRVSGQLSTELIKEAKLIVEKTDTDIVLFLDYSDFTIQKGSLFNYIIIDGVKFKIHAHLRYITQQFSLPFEEIPYGWKTVGYFELDNLLDFVHLIPFSKGWLSTSQKIKIGYENQGI